MFVFTESGSDFKLTELEPGRYKVQRMSLSSMRYQAFAADARIHDGPAKGRQMIGVDVRPGGTAYDWRSSRVVQVRGPFDHDPTEVTA
jgi:formylmethanofuran dehydrogenase subunit B